MIVFLVNSFFFPMRRETLFKHNMKSLFRLHNDYWELIRRGITGMNNLSITTEILIYFHTIYDVLRLYYKGTILLWKQQHLSSLLHIGQEIP